MMHTDHDETRPAANRTWRAANRSARTVTVVVATVLCGLVLTVAFGASEWVHAQTVDNHYAHMAPLADYLDTDVAAEMALALSAAPPAISRDATVLVLKRS